MASFVAGVALLIGLVIAESRVEQPIMPLAMFRNRNRMVALVNMLLISSAMFGVFFFLTQFLQVVHDFSPLRSGLAFLPMSISILIASRIAPGALRRLGSRTLMTAGAVFFAAALLWLSRATEDGNYWTQIFFPFILLGFGGGFSFMPMNLTIMSSLRPEQTGAGAGTLQTFQQVGGAIGLAVLVTIFSTRQENALTDGMSSLAAMTQGVQGGFLAASAIALIAVLLVGLGITSRTSAEGSPAKTVVVDAH
jgi:predicted MFS family arabinose efflux permease